jgi:hypothetical protein
MFAASWLDIAASAKPDFAAATTLLRFAALWVTVGLIGGFVMQSQPWYRSLYLMLPIALFVLTCSTVR